MLTVVWTVSVVVGRCDLDENGESVDGECTDSYLITRQGVTLLSDVKSGISVMLFTSLLYLIVQSLVWYSGVNSMGDQPTYVKEAALVTMVLCSLSLVLYLAFSIFNSKANERLVRLHKEELMKKNVLRIILMQTGLKEGVTLGESYLLVKKYFRAWHIATGSKAIKDKIGLLEKEVYEVDEDDV